MTWPLVFGAGAVPPDLGRTVVTVGNFDGVHLGHQAMLAQATGIAVKLGLPAGAVTFVPHPVEVLRPGSNPRFLTGLRHKVALLGEAGVAFVCIVPFTPALAERSAEEFATGMLFDTLRADAVTVGSSFRFGHGAAGDVALLARLGAARGVEVHGVDLAEAGGEPVSSTRVRAALSAGDVATAATLLGRPFVLEGRVVAGAGRGRSIGVPTANLRVPRRLLIPGIGTYAGRLLLGPPPYPVTRDDAGDVARHLARDEAGHLAEGHLARDEAGHRAGDVASALPAVINVGVNPTFGGTTLKVEAHVLDAEVDLRGRRVALGIERRLRGERRFASVDELVAQIRRDIDEARRLLA